MEKDAVELRKQSIENKVYLDKETERQREEQLKFELEKQQAEVELMRKQMQVEQERYNKKIEEQKKQYESKMKNE